MDKIIESQNNNKKIKIPMSKFCTRHWQLQANQFSLLVFGHRKLNLFWFDKLYLQWLPSIIKIIKWCRRIWNWWSQYESMKMSVKWKKMWRNLPSTSGSTVAIFQPSIFNQHYLNIFFIFNQEDFSLTGPMTVTFVDYNNPKSSPSCLLG